MFGHDLYWILGRGGLGFNLIYLVFPEKIHHFLIILWKLVKSFAITSQPPHFDWAHLHVITSCLWGFLLVLGGSQQSLCRGINYFKEGSDPPLLPDSEYPEWLWNTFQPKQPLDEEFADSDNKAYWKRLRKMKIRQANEATKKKKWNPKFVIC